jgi:hypothetical protein
MQVHRDHHIVTQGSSSWPSGSLQARRAMQLLAAQTTLEPQPHRVSRTGRGAVREPEHPPGRRQPIRERARPAQRPRIPDPQAPSDDLNKLPNTSGGELNRRAGGWTQIGLIWCPADRLPGVGGTVCRRDVGSLDRNTRRAEYSFRFRSALIAGVWIAFRVYGGRRVA